GDSRFLLLAPWFSAPCFAPCSSALASPCLPCCCWLAGSFPVARRFIAIRLPPSSGLSRPQRTLVGDPTAAPARDFPPFPGGPSAVAAGAAPCRPRGAGEAMPTRRFE